MGKLASSRGGSKDVRDFGKMLVRDHTKGGQEARKLARQLKVKAPNDAPPDAAEMKAALSKLKGAEFDGNSPPTWSTTTRRTSTGTSSRPTARPIPR